MKRIIIAMLALAAYVVYTITRELSVVSVIIGTGLLAFVFFMVPKPKDEVSEAIEDNDYTPDVVNSAPNEVKCCELDESDTVAKSRAWKTYREWFELLLPEPYKSQAIANASPEKINRKVARANCLYYAFSWGKSTEGFTHWRDANNKYIKCCL